MVTDSISRSNRNLLTHVFHAASSFTHHHFTHTQALLQGPLLAQLQQHLEGLPPDVVQSLQAMVGQLADNIGQHGQQVRAVEALLMRWPAMVWVCRAAIVLRQAVILLLCVRRHLTLHCVTSLLSPVPLSCACYSPLGAAAVGC